MLTGKRLGDAIAVAIKRKLESGAVKSKAEIARHFHVKLPSIYDWVKKGSISKDKLPELWAFFADVAGPEHWGMPGWPGGGSVVKEYVAAPEVPAVSQHWRVSDNQPMPYASSIERTAYKGTRAAIELLLLPPEQRTGMPADVQAAITFIENVAIEEMARRKSAA